MFEKWLSFSIMELSHYGLIQNTIVMNEDMIMLTENILDIFRKKNKGIPVEQEEIDNVIVRFRELVNAPKV